MSTSSSQASPNCNTSSPPPSPNGHTPSPPDSPNYDTPSPSHDPLLIPSPSTPQRQIFQPKTRVGRPGLPSISQQKLTILRQSDTFLKDDAVASNVYNTSLLNVNGLKCVDCQRVFYMRNKLRLHYVLDHEVLYCKPCDVFVESVDEAEGHRQRIHEGKTCDFCHIAIDNNDISNHYLAEHDAVMCPYCIAYIRPTSELSSHVRLKHLVENVVESPDQLFKMHPNDSFFCYLCGKNRKKELIGHFTYYHKMQTFTLAENLRQKKVNLNSLLEHPEVTSITSQCHICEETLTDYVPMAFHLIYCRNQQYCPQCSHLYTNSRTLHMHTFEKHRRHPCTLDCTNLAYDTVENLTKHYRAYHGREKCDLCEEFVVVEEVEGEVGALLKHLKMGHACVGRGLVGGRFERLLDIKQGDENDINDTCQLVCLLCDDPLPSNERKNIYLHFFRAHSMTQHNILRLIGNNLSNKLPNDNQSDKEDDDSLLEEVEGQEMGEMQEEDTEEIKEKEPGEILGKIVVPVDRNDDIVQDYKQMFDEHFVSCLFDFNEIMKREPIICELCQNFSTCHLQQICHLFTTHKINVPSKYLRCLTCNISTNQTDILNHFKHYTEEPNLGETNITFNCNLCHTDITLNAAFQHYTKVHHKSKDVKALKKYGFKCRFCNRHYWTSKRRNKHETTDHIDNYESFYKCAHCCKIYTDLSLIKAHMCEQNPDYTLPVLYHCLKCSAVLPTLAEMNGHFVKYHEEFSRIICPFEGCARSFRILKYAKRHFKTIHDRSAAKKEHPCDICNKVFTTKLLCSVHKRKHKLTGRGFVCKLCEEKFVTRVEREHHYATQHAGERLFSCNTCDEKFNSKSVMSLHRSLHKQPTLNCTYCGKVFTRRDSYKEHLLIHEGPRHQCPHCPKSFTQMSNLRRHLRIHTGDKPYKCTFCEKSFTDAGACKSHISVHTRDQDCNCPICGKGFSKKQKLKYHMKKHTGEGLIHCTVCDKSFVDGYNLRVHMMCHQGDGTPFQCTLCQKTFLHKRNLSHHMTTQHKNPKPKKNNRKTDIESEEDSEMYDTDNEEYSPPIKQHLNTDLLVKKRPKRKTQPIQFVDIKVEPVESEEFNDETD